MPSMTIVDSVIRAAVGTGEGVGGVVDDQRVVPRAAVSRHVRYSGRSGEREGLKVVDRDRVIPGLAVDGDAAQDGGGHAVANGHGVIAVAAIDGDGALAIGVGG